MSLTLAGVEADTVATSTKTTPESTADDVQRPGPVFLDRQQVADMRQALADMGLGELSKEGDEPQQGTSQKERTLADMVLRLIEWTTALSAQITAQAESITHLDCQRDLIITRHHQDRDLWEADKNSMLRANGAILQRVRKEGILSRVEDLERENHTVMADNRILQSRFQESQSRLDSLESELVALRPYFLTKSEDSLQNTYTRRPSPPAPPLTRSGAGRTRKRDLLAIHHASMNNEDEKQLLQDSYPTMTMRHNPFRSPTFGDARIEHMLLAARKLGRDRAAKWAPPASLEMVTLVSAPGTTVTPALKIKSYGPPPEPSTPTQPPRAGPSRTPAPLTASISKNPRLAPHATILSVPSPRSNADTNGHTGATSGLESLLSAATRMLHEPEDGSNRSGSPSKRRKLDATTSAPAPAKKKKSAAALVEGRSQTMSALDLLADQAAAFSSSQDLNAGTTEGEDEDAEGDDETMDAPRSSPVKTSPQFRRTMAMHRRHNTSSPLRPNTNSNGNGHVIEHGYGTRAKGKARATPMLPISTSTVTDMEDDVVFGPIATPRLASKSTTPQPNGQVNGNLHPHEKGFRHDIGQVLDIFMSGSTGGTGNASGSVNHSARMQIDDDPSETVSGVPANASNDTDTAKHQQSRKSPIAEGGIGSSDNPGNPAPEGSPVKGKRPVRKSRRRNGEEPESDSIDPNGGEDS